jgi:phytanoyl-CoA hydroxylase
MFDDVLTGKKNSLKKTMLNPIQVEQYHRDGYLVLDDFIHPDLCHLLRARANQIIDATDIQSMQSIFSTKQSENQRDHYWLESGDKIRCFFEEGAFDAKGDLTCDKLMAINKIGHALHDLDPLFNCFSRSHKIAQTASDIGVDDALLIQSMYIFKQPYIGGEVTCHQDSTYLYAQELPVTGFWFALEDATIDNGCLWAIPGAHRSPLKSRLIRKKDKVEICVMDNTPWSLEKMIPLEVSRGSLIILHGLLPHMSKENLSSQSRHAYTLHLMSGLSTFAADNWLRRAPNMPFRGFL